MGLPLDESPQRAPETPTHQKNEREPDEDEEARDGTNERKSRLGVSKECLLDPLTSGQQKEESEEKTERDHQKLDNGGHFLPF